MEIQSYFAGLTTPAIVSTTSVDSSAYSMGKGGNAGKAAKAYGENSLVSSSLTIGQDEIATFAKDMMARIDASGLGAENAGEGAGANLEQALAGSVDYVRENFGDEAAVAMVGIMYKGLGEGEISEDDLGQSLLNVVKFMDQNFGFAGGDKVMAQFNGQLNESLNRYFENGFEEKFYAVNGESGTTNQLMSALTMTASTVADKFGDEAAQTVMDIITSNLEENGITRSSIADGLDEAAAYLKENFGEEADAFAQSLASGFASVMDSLYPSDQTQTASGTSLDVMV